MPRQNGTKLTRGAPARTGAEKRVTTTEPACQGTPEVAALRVERLPFRNVPGQSRLFLEYLEDPTRLRRFYPEAVRFHYELSERRSRVLDNHRADRAALCDALGEANARWGAGPETLANVERLRSPDSVAVVTGQQTGLFTGPLYTLYKALSAVKLAACLTARGTEAVPVFWMATEDHDWEEVQTAQVIACDGRLAEVSRLRRPAPRGRSRSAASRSTEASRRPCGVSSTSSLRASSCPSLSASCATHTNPVGPTASRSRGCSSALTSDYGLVLLDPTDGALKRLAAPLYAEAARLGAEIASATDARSRELEKAGYHAQVHTSPDSFPLFLIDEGGARRALTRTREGRYLVKGTTREWTIEELAALASEQPDA